MRREPDERFHVTVAATIEPEHPIEAKLWRCSRQLETCPHMERALEVYNDLFERERLQPWILANTASDEIGKRIGVTVEMVDAYRHLFFNMDMFRDLLEKQRWVSFYGERPGTTRAGELYLQKAMLHGVEATAHVLGAPSYIEPGVVIDGVMKDAYFRGLAARDAKLTSNEATAAHNFQKTAVAIANEQAKVRPPGVNDILIRIKNRDLTNPLAAVTATEEILH